MQKEEIEENVQVVSADKVEHIENVEASMGTEELKARTEAFEYYSEQEQHLNTWSRQKWEEKDKKFIRRVNRAYKNEMHRIKDERKGMSNMIMSDKARISLYNGEINNNILTIAGSGRGKTYSVVLPNILQANASFVCSDPKGDLLRRCGTFLVEQGYKVRSLNLINMLESNSYNPFHYLHKEREEEVMTLIDTIMKNTDGEKKSSDPFWEKGEQLFVQSVFFWMLYELRSEEQSLPKALEIMRLAEIKEDKDDFISDYDAIMLRLGYQYYDMFDDDDEAWSNLVDRAESGDEECRRKVAYYEEEKRKQEEYRDNHIAYIQYKHFKAGAGKTAKSIIISAVARLAPYNLNSLKNMSLYDEMQLDMVGEEKTAIFVVLPPTNKTFEFVSGMMFTQLFNELNICANVKHGEEGARLPVPVRFILDEFKNTGRIPMFTEILAYARSLNISIMPILQSLEQLKDMYEKEWQVILDNCATFLFLGGIRNMDTLKYVSELLGKGTFDKKSYSRSKGTQNSTSTQFDKVGIDLMTPAKLQKFPKHQCILFISGYSPIWEKTYDLKKHPNFSRSEDGGNTPYKQNSEEIIHKREMYQLYLKKINHELDESTPILEFWGNTLQKTFSMYDKVLHAVRQDKKYMIVESEDIFSNAISMDDFEVYSTMDYSEEEQNEYMQNETVTKLHQMKQAQDSAVEQMFEKPYTMSILQKDEILNMTRNAIKNQDIVFSSSFISANAILDAIMDADIDNNDDSDEDKKASFGVGKDEKIVKAEKAIKEQQVTKQENVIHEEKLKAIEQEQAIKSKKDLLISESEHENNLNDLMQHMQKDKFLYKQVMDEQVINLESDSMANIEEQGDNVLNSILEDVDIEL